MAVNDVASTTEFTDFTPKLPQSQGMAVQVLGSWGPNVDANTGASYGSIPIPSESSLIDLDTAANGNTTVISSGTLFQPGAVYEMTLVGTILGLSGYFTFEWGGKASASTPAPSTTDWGWPFGGMPQFVFTAKPWQEKLSLKFILASDALGSWTNAQMAVRRLR